MQKTRFISFLFLFVVTTAVADTISLSLEKSALGDTILTTFSSKTTNEQENIYKKRLEFLDNKTPMDLSYNEKVQPFIDSYLSKNKILISRMQALAQLYFPLFEQQLDKYELPLEFKYLAIVESALNPKARSSSGATGLWQFMYLTGREYGLEVSSYVDERQDPFKSTQAACEYFVKLYDLFGDWNLVLAAYNGGPGYLQRKINTVGSYDFWQLYPHLRTETRNYVPTFIAVNYAMNYAHEHDIQPIHLSLNIEEIDTFTIKEQIETKTLIEITCIDKETIQYLNPSYKKDVFPKNAVLTLPKFVIRDFLENEESNYLFVNSVKNKEVLIDEERVVYTVLEGDYLGKIAKEHNVKVFELKKWNNLFSTRLDIGDKLVLYVKKRNVNVNEKPNNKTNEYVIKKGDTLWDIAKKHDGVSVWKIKSLNNMETDKLTPGTKIILPEI